MLYLPETLGTRLPDTIEEVRGGGGREFIGLGRDGDKGGYRLGERRR